MSDRSELAFYIHTLPKTFITSLAPENMIENVQDFHSVPVIFETGIGFAIY
jgi:hypothetical protein